MRCCRIGKLRNAVAFNINCGIAIKLLYRNAKYCFASSLNGIFSNESVASQTARLLQRVNLLLTKFNSGVIFGLSNFSPSLHTILLYYWWCIFCLEFIHLLCSFLNFSIILGNVLWASVQKEKCNRCPVCGFMLRTRPNMKLHIFGFGLVREHGRK